MKRIASIAALAVALMIAAPQAAPLDEVTPPAVPTNLDVPAGITPFLLGHAYGTQNYVCLLARGGFGWTFFGPQATLFDDFGNQLITHFLSPNPDQNYAPRATWQHSVDTSSAWALASASSSDPTYVASGAIPWLLLRVVGVQNGPALGDTLTATTFIHRVNTTGGIAPATGCAVAADVGKKVFVPYAADYVFYRP